MKSQLLPIRSLEQNDTFLTSKQHQKDIMTIKRLAKKKKKEKFSKKEGLTDSFINCGGKTTHESEKKLESNELDFRFTLRIPRNIIQKIDFMRKQRVGNFSRNNWVLEAIYEKLKSK